MTKHGYRYFGIANYHARQYFLAPLYVAWNTLARQCGSIKRSPLGLQRSVQRHTLARLHTYRLAHLNFLRTYGFGLPVSYHFGCFRLKTKQSVYVSFSFSHSPVLPKLADAIKQHHRYSFGKLADGEGTYRGYAHQQKLAEEIFMADAFYSLFHNRHSYRKISDDVPQQPYSFVLQ